MKIISLCCFVLFVNATLFCQVTDGLQGHWPFDGDALDVSGNENHGTVHGATLSSDRFGVESHAYCFDGIDDYIVTAFSGVSGSTSRTISFWAKIDSDGNPVNSAGTEVITYGDTPATGPGNSFRVTMNRACTGMGAGLGESTYTLSSSMPTTDEWHFFTLIYDADISSELGDFVYYVDGELIPNSHCDSYNLTVNVNTSTTVPLYFGRLYLVSQPRWFTGCLDDIRIYDRVLTADEIDELYNEEQGQAAVPSESLETLGVNLYPNPVSSILTLEIDNPDISIIEILSVDGKKVFHANLTNTINVAEYANGLYTLLFYNSKGELQASKKFAKTSW